LIDGVEALVVAMLDALFDCCAEADASGMDIEL